MTFEHHPHETQKSPPRATHFIMSESCLKETNAAFECIVKHSATFGNVSCTCPMAKQNLQARETSRNLPPNLKVS